MLRPMIASKPNTSRVPNELGALLRHWRDVRGRSQIELSMDTGVSQGTSVLLKAGAALQVARH